MASLVVGRVDRAGGVTLLVDQHSHMRTYPTHPPKKEYTQIVDNPQED